MCRRTGISWSCDFQYWAGSLMEIREAKQVGSGGFGVKAEKKRPCAPASVVASILTEMKQKQSRWGVLPGPLFSGADAGVGELWEHNPCWSCGQLCNNGSYSRITAVSGLWLATTLLALFKVTVLGWIPDFFLHWSSILAPGGSSAEQERQGGWSAPGNCWRLQCLVEPPFTSYSP